MKYYTEITILPVPDMGPHFILEKTFQQIHLRLADLQQEGKVPVGLAFPQYDQEKHLLGRKIRLFAAERAVLEALALPQYLRGLKDDYIGIDGIRKIPPRVAAYACYMRRQPKSSNVRLARRKARRADITVEEALKILNQYQEERVTTPFIRVRSRSTGQHFRLFIHRRETPALVFVNNFLI